MPHLLCFTNVAISRRNWLCAIPALLPFCLGCGGGPNDQPELGQVTGVVTLDSQPLANARVVFSPEAGGQSSESTTDEQGRYELSYRGPQKGAIVGKHKVHVSTFEAAYPDDSGEMIGGRAEEVPDKYNTNTQLIVEVKAGINDLPLKLEK